MRQCADADPLNAGFGDAADAAEVHAAGCLQLDGRSDRAAPGDGLAEFARLHVVQQHQVRTGRQHRVELIERIHFDLDDHRRRGVRSRLLPEEAAGQPDGLGGRVAEGIGCSRRRRRLRTEGQVVVLDEDGLEQAGAMVPTAAAADGVFFQPAPAGGGFAGIVDSCLGSGDRIDVFPRRVAMPDRRPSRFNSTRSAAKMPRAGPSTTPTGACRA